jgi:hypothetical protein
LFERNKSRAFPVYSADDAFRQSNKGDTTMYNKITLALTAALILGTAPSAFAGAKHHAAKAPVHGTVASTAAFGANALAGGGSLVRPGETYMQIQDRDWSNQTGNPYCGGRC